MKRLYLLLSLPLSLAAIACGGGGGGDGADAAPDPACAIQSNAEGVPGAPYDLAGFKTSIIPLLVADCAGCHNGGFGNYFVYNDAAAGGCNQVKTFNSFVTVTDLVNPNNSRIITAIDGTNTGHTEKQYPAGDPKIATLLSFIQAAAANNGGTAPPPSSSPADQAVFANAIQPALDAGNCTSGACHGGGAGGFTVVAMATGADLTANFSAAVARIDLNTPANSRLYLKAITAHSGSTPLPQAADAALLAWIEAAKVASQNTGGGGVGGGAGCAPATNFNGGVWRDELLPMLRGVIDFNDLENGNSTFGGCVSASAGCHESNRGPGKFTLSNDVSDSELLANFACFVNTANPSRSAAVMCPLGSGGRAYCPVTTGHPGGEIFFGPDDLNFQRLLSFVYSGKDVVQPFDFAFFVRNINTLFNDINAVQNGEAGFTCADVNFCHGVTGAGSQVPGGSNFPIIAGASAEGDLLFNFTSAAAFSNFLLAEDSSLRIYPTNLIFAGSNLSLGINHPGDECFPPGSELDGLILQFVAGLQPNAAGFLLNFLVAGDFSATAVTDSILLDTLVEQNPEYQYKLFERNPPGNREFNGGQADLLTSDDVVEGFIDLNDIFPRDATAGRIAYAQTCIFNSSPIATDIQLVVSGAQSNNAIEVYVDGQRRGIANDGQVTTVIMPDVPSYLNGGTPLRVLVKTFQSNDDIDFGFSFQVLDELNQPFVNGEIIQTTSCAEGTGL